MIRVGELDPFARESAFHLALVTDPRLGVTSYAFHNSGNGPVGAPTTDELYVRTPGGVYTEAVISRIIEIGFGDYAYRHTLDEVLVAGDIYLFANPATSQQWTGSESVRYQVSGIPAGEAADIARQLPFHLPDVNNPLTPFNGGAAYTFTTGQIKLRLPGGVYFNADPSRVLFKGNGDFAYVLDDTGVAARGKVFFAVVVTGAQTWTQAYDIVGAAAAVLVVTAPVPVPVGEGLSVEADLTQRQVIIVVPTAINVMLMAAENIVDNLRVRQRASLSLPSLYKRAHLIAHETNEIAVVKSR